MASTPAYVVLLVGLGATDLSMTPSAIPRVRRTIAGIDTGKAQSRSARNVLSVTRPTKLRILSVSALFNFGPQLFDASSLPKPRKVSTLA